MANPEEIARLVELTVRAAFPTSGPNGVHPGQWAVLRYLRQAESEASTIRHVASYLGVTHAPASRAVAALARKGLVLATIDQADHRCRRLALSAKGESLLAEDPIHRLTAVIEGLGALREKEFADTLALLRDQLTNHQTENRPEKHPCGLRKSST